MEIAVFSQPEGLSGKPEVWVQVQADELLDWPRVKNQLDSGQRKLIDRCERLPVGYHPTLLGPDDKYRYEDWWVFKPIDALEV